ncbi:MAG: hypothetical protein GX086_12730 [Alcaligenaceae bacterium]|nr:hypothetical protein [Alcaligenaceae bacterium]
MAIAQGIYKVVGYKKETTFGTKATAAGANTIPRTNFALNLIKNAFQSNRMTTHQQASGTRHGTRRVEGSYQDEISCGTHKDFWSALLRGPWTAGTVSPAAPGRLWVPQTGHTDDSFTFEEWRKDITESRVFVGVKVTQAAVSVQPNGMATVNFSLMGQDMDSPIGTAQYFTTPTAVPDNEPASGAVGELSVDGTAVAVVTAADFTVNGNASVGEVIGAAVTPDVFRGTLIVTGNFTLYHKDKALLQKYLDEDTIALAIKLDEPNGTDYIKFAMPKVTITSYTTEDVNGGVTAQCAFNADINDAGVDAEAKSIIKIEDSRVTA